MGIFSSKKIVNDPMSRYTPQQRTAIEALMSLAATGSGGGITLGEGYGGSLGNYQVGQGVQQNIDYLQSLLLSPQMQQTQQTYSNLADTKFNPDDPSSGYAAFQRQLAKAQKQAGSALERESAITGGRFGTQIIKSKGESQADFADQSASYLANLFQNAKQSQLAGAQGLQSLLRTQSNLANQAMSAQDMQRQLQNQEAQAKFNEWARARAEKMTQIDLMKEQWKEPMGATTTKVPGIGMKMLGELIPSIGSYNTHQYGYTTNQSSMSDAINAMMSMFGIPG